MYINVINVYRCYAEVGRQFWKEGPTLMSLGEWCIQDHIIAHLLMHVLGNFLLVSLIFNASGRSDYLFNCDAGSADPRAAPVILRGTHASGTTPRRQVLIWSLLSFLYGQFYKNIEAQIGEKFRTLSPSDEINWFLYKKSKCATLLPCPRERAHVYFGRVWVFLIFRRFEPRCSNEIIERTLFFTISFVGFLHESTRPDRDSFISYYPDRLNKSKWKLCHNKGNIVVRIQRVKVKIL